MIQGGDVYVLALHLLRSECMKVSQNFFSAISFVYSSRNSALSHEDASPSRNHMLCYSPYARVYSIERPMAKPQYLSSPH
jgi:hypothetical protein